MSARFLHLVRLDVAHDREKTFNDVYTHNKRYLVSERI